MDARRANHAWDPQNEITADVIRADLNLKRANADGNVCLTARPKDAKTETGQRARSRVKEPVVVRCDTIQYFYKDKKGTATGNLRITQKDPKGDRTATGDRLAYDGNEDTISLEGNVHVTTTRGEGFKCKQVIFHVKDGAEGFQVKGLTGGVFYLQEDEEEETGDRRAGNLGQYSRHLPLQSDRCPPAATGRMSWAGAWQTP